jgi:membrane fusion protein, multidrug efflux system
MFEEPESASKFKGLGIAVIVIGFLSLVAYHKFFAGHPGGPHGMMGMGGPVAVDVAEVVERDVQLWHEFPGRLAAIEEAEVRPRISGPVETIKFKNGARVQKGEPLFTIDPKPYAAEVSRLQGLLSQAQAQAALAQTEFERAEGLFSTKAISQREFDQRRNDLNVARAAVKTAQAGLEKAQLFL